MPSAGLVFHASLKDASKVAETGQALSFDTDYLPSEEVDGIPCIRFNGYGYGITFPDTGFPEGSSPRTLSLWCKNDGNTSQGMLLGYGQQSSSKMVNIALQADGSVTNSIYGDDGNWARVYPDTDKWFHIALTYNGTAETLYLNGVAGSSLTKSFNTLTSSGWIGTYGYQYDYSPKAYIAGCRVYDRVLTDAEIRTLAAEFVPALIYPTSPGFDELGHAVGYRSASSAGCAALRIPKRGLILHIPLSSGASEAVTGQTLTTEGTLQYSTFSGVPCAYFDGASYVKTVENSGLAGTVGRTFSFWAYPANSQSYCCAVGCGGTQSTGRMFNCGSRIVNDNIMAEFTTWNNDIDLQCFADDNRLHHFAYVYDPATPDLLTIHVDGVPHTHSVSGIDTQDSPFWLGRSGGGGWWYAGHLAGVRVYDRALTGREIAALRAEFEPQAA